MVTSQERNLLVTNRIARILGTLTSLLFIYILASFGFSFTSPVILALATFFFIVPFINKSGFTNVTRVLICVTPVIATLCAALSAKIFETGHSDILFYDARFFLIIFAIIPCLIFDTSEKNFLYGTLILGGIALILFDPIHEAFGVGYYQLGFDGRSYYYINIVTIISFLAISGGAIALKRVIEAAERQNAIFQDSLRKTNQKLQESYNDIEAQNEEIMAQSEELAASQESLLEANQTIEEQKLALELQVNEVNGKLLQTNEELIKHNNELQQFSFTISHNLRGPTARLLGLSHLLASTAEFERNREIKEIVDHIQTSAYDLDMVIRDLNNIVDIRHALYNVREDVYWEKIWSDVKHQLKITDDFVSRHFTIKFSEAPVIFSIKPMITSIMHNLVSNCLRFKSPERTLNVQIATRKRNGFTQLEITDNGVGIDLPLHQAEMFKMYNRFHSHQEGKGLGLYVVKSQVDLLNGFVHVKSQPEVGSTFTVNLPDPD